MKLTLFILICFQLLWWSYGHLTIVSDRPKVERLLRWRWNPAIIFRIEKQPVPKTQDLASITGSESVSSFSQVSFRGSTVQPQIAMTDKPTSSPTLAPTYGLQHRHSHRIEQANARAAFVVMVTMALLVSCCLGVGYCHSKYWQKPKTISVQLRCKEQEAMDTNSGPDQKQVIVKIKPAKTHSNATVVPIDSINEQRKRSEQPLNKLNKVAAMAEDEVKPFGESSIDSHSTKDRIGSGGGLELLVSRPSEQRAMAREEHDLVVIQSDGSLCSEDTKGV
jgi:hypothetical protein